MPQLFTQKSSREIGFTHLSFGDSTKQFSSTHFAEAKFAIENLAEGASAGREMFEKLKKELDKKGINYREWRYRGERERYGLAFDSAGDSLFALRHLAESGKLQLFSNKPEVFTDLKKWEQEMVKEVQKNLVTQTSTLAIYENEAKKDESYNDIVERQKKEKTFLSEFLAELDKKGSLFDRKNETANITLGFAKSADKKSDSVAPSDESGLSNKHPRGRSKSI